jgi:transcriptional regulator with PAS, ATPase and Fis domain
VSAQGPHHLRDLLDRLVTEMVRGGLTLEDARTVLEKRFIEQVLEGADHHIGRAAERLGVHRNSLARKIEEYHVKRR